MRKKIIHLYKDEGETPLQRLDRFRTEESEYKNATLGYAGRLDPMAEGWLLILIDDENTNREKHLGLNKIYEIDILLGLSTDTADALGILTAGEEKTDELQFERIARSFIGDIMLPYPSYSSRTINGKALFEWAREGKINEIEIPKRASTIYDIKFLDSYSLTARDLLAESIERVRRVKGDFRQKEVIDSWNAVLEDSTRSFVIHRIEVSCSSGTYMRSLAEAIGQKLGLSAMAWKIKRTLIGSFRGNDKELHNAEK